MLSLVVLLFLQQEDELLAIYIYLPP